MPKNYGGGKAVTSANDRTGGISLNACVKVFPTTSTRGFTNTGSLKTLAAAAANEDEFNRMAYQANRKRKEALWPSPTTSDANGAGKHGEGGLDLRTAASLWPTPKASDAGHGGRTAENSAGRYSHIRLLNKALKT
jgi:hypothetical protein